MGEEGFGKSDLCRHAHVSLRVAQTTPVKTLESVFSRVADQLASPHRSRVARCRVKGRRGGHSTGTHLSAHGLSASERVHLGGPELSSSPVLNPSLSDERW